MEDNYSHNDNSVIYVQENIPGPTEDSQEYNQIVENFNSQLSFKCNCNIKCEPSTCSCNNIYCVKNYITSSNHEIKLNKEKFEDFVSPIIECNGICSCSENCGNRLVQKGPLKSLYVKNCISNKGLGLFSTNFIAKYTFVCEYAGEIVTKQQAAIRHKHNKEHGLMNYIFCLNEHGHNTITQTFVDPSKFGNIGRYANHSCDPNCVIIPVRVDTPIPKLSLFSSRDIPPHTEITFHYGSSVAMNILPMNGERTKCLCDTVKCLGWMPFQAY